MERTEFYKHLKRDYAKSDQTKNGYFSMLRIDEKGKKRKQNLAQVLWNDFDLARASANIVVSVLAGTENDREWCVCIYIYNVYINIYPSVCIMYIYIYKYIYICVCVVCVYMYMYIQY